MTRWLLCRMMGGWLRLKIEWERESARWEIGGGKGREEGERGAVSWD